MQQLGAAARFGPVGEKSGCQTTFSYSAWAMAEVCSDGGDSMKNRGESVEALLVVLQISSRQFALSYTRA